MLLHKNLQIYEFKINDLPYDNLKKKIIYDHFVEKHFFLLKTNKEYQTIYNNFMIDLYANCFDILYEKFLDLSKQLFGKITLTPKNRRTCFAFVSKKGITDPYFYKHSHINTSVINSVFYFSVPDENSGKLYFFDNEDKIAYEYQPKENSLIIFPNYLTHSPTSCNSEDFRIAINMEIICEENVWNSK